MSDQSNVPNFDLNFNMDFNQEESDQELADMEICYGIDQNTRSSQQDTVNHTTEPVSAASTNTDEGPRPRSRVKTHISTG